MARRTGPFSLCAAALLLCAVSTQADKCRTGCGGVTPNTFKYQEGTTYRYNLESTIQISLSSAEGQHTSTKLTGIVLLTQQPECNQVLRLQNVQVVGPDAKKYSGLANIDKPIRLNFHDGHVESVICTDPADTQNSLNIKRAVASLFQAALGHHGDEQDVFGHCQGDISQRKEGNNVIIQKSRDLTRCSNREAIRQDFMSTSFNLRAVAGTGPVFANYESEQRLKNGILDHATVTENYLYKPFSDGKAHGAKAVVTTKISLAGQKKENVNAKVSEPRSIHFDAPHQEVAKSANVDSILNALRETKKTMDVSVSERSAETFLQLVRVLRASRKDDILAVYGQIKTGAGGFKDKISARKVFFDALIRTGTGDAIEVVVELIRNKELNSIEQKFVYLSLSFVRHATKGSLTSAAGLLDQADLPREAYLGIGTLAGRFCREHSCENVEELNRLLQKLASKLNPTPANRKAENEVIAVLKSLSNVGHLSGSVSEKVASLITAGKAPTRLRVAALETAASDACHPKLLSSALHLLKNRQEDSEIRIKAYLVLVECPDQKIAQGVKEVVETEPVYQVGGYITSHLRNLRASTNPSRERAQQYLGNIRVGPQYPIDPRKYSFNTEMSYSWDTLGSANVIEGDVIYSQNSWLPRSIGMNVSGDILGHSVNLVEIDLRQENVDRLLEHYFGPLGVLEEYANEDVVKGGKDSLDKIIDHVKQRLEKTRGKRDVSRNEIEAFAKTVKQLGSDLNKDLELDLSLKIFGSELLFLSLNEDIQRLTPDGIIDKIFDDVDIGLNGAKNFEHHMKNHLLFADMEVSYPTAMGFPLRWTLQGSAAVHFITSGQLDIRQILKDPKNAQVHLKLIPSANIEITGGISIDAHFISTGLKITANVLSSTGTDVTVKLLNNEGIDVKLGLPVEKQKLVSFRHTLEFASQELGKPEVVQQLKFKDKLREFSICFDQLSPLIGLTFCGEFNAPSTLASNHVGFPLNGNVNLELSIERDDVTEYHFRALLKEPNPDTKSVTISFSTPGSKTSRDVTLLLEASTSPSKHLRATLQSPFKEAVAEAVLTDTATEKSALVRFQHDKQEYLAKIGVNVKGGADKQVYTPLVEWSTPNDVMKTKGGRKPDYTVEGQVIVERQGDARKFTFDHVKMIAPGQPPIQINGYVAREGPTTYSADVQVSRDSVNVAGKGKLQYGPDNLKINAELQNSVNPNANFNVKMDLKKAERGFDNSIVLIHGADLSSKKHCLTLVQSVKYQPQSDDTTFDFTTKNKLTYPLLGVEGKLDAHVSKNLYSYDLTVAYDKFKLQSELDAKLATKQVGDYDIEFELEVMNNKLELNAKREIEGDRSKVHNSLELSGRKYQIDGTITHHVKPNDMNIGTDLVIKVHGRPDPLKIDTGLTSNSQNLDSHAKILLGSTALVDIVIKGTRGTNPNGSLKVLIHNIVIANGNFKVTGGKGTGQIVVEIPKIDRKIKAEGQFTCQDHTHNAVLNVFFDFEKDNEKKLHLETNNQITKNSYDSKNTVTLLGQSLALNTKGQLTGTLTQGTITGQFDLTIPNGDVISGNLNRQLNIVDNIANGNGQATLQHQHGGQTRKVDLKATIKNSNVKIGVLDIEWNLVFANPEGKDAKLDLIVKQDGQKHSLYKSNLHGSLLPHPLTSSIENTYNHGQGSHEASILYGPAIGVKLHGKYNIVGAQQAGQPLSGGLEVELLLPGDKYKNVKIAMDGSATRPEQPDGVYAASGSISGTLDNAKTLKLVGSTKASIHNGEVRLDLTLPNDDPLSFGAKYNREKTEQGGKVHGEVDLTYAKGKQAKAGITLNKINNDESDMEVTLLTPNEAAKDITLHITNKRSSNNRHFSNEVVLTADGKRYSSTSELVISEINPSLDIVIRYPDGKHSRILAKFNRVSPKEFNSELKIQSIKDFNLEASGEANIASIDDFHILVNIDSEKLQLNKVRFEAANKPAKGGKKIQFSAKSGDKNLLSGSTSYKANEEGGKFIVEGSGSVKVREDTRTATFKYIKRQLTQEKDGEQGVEILLNAGVGSQGVVSELKMTNKQFRVLNSYCEEKKQCAHLEIFSKTNAVDASEFNHELEINIDLRKLGLSHEFGLKSVTNRKDLVLDHTVDVHFESSASSKYQYSLYVHPKEAGIQITTPKRVISLEAKGDLKGEAGKGKQGSIKAEIALYLNKNAEPNKKTVLSYNCVHQMDNNAGNANVDIKFATPGIPKELSISYVSKYSVPAKTAEVTIDLDIFAKKNQKLTIAAKTHADKIEGGYKVVSDGSISSKGLNLELVGREVIVLSTKELVYDCKLNYQLDKTKLDNAVLLKANMKKLELLVKALNKNLIHIDSALDLSKESQVANTKLSALGLEDLVIHVESKNFNTIFATLAKKATPQNKLRLSAGLILGQIADARVEVEKGGAKTDVAHASIKLDDANFMKPDFAIDTDFISNKLVPGIQKDNTAVIQRLRAAAEETQKTLSNEIQQLKDLSRKSVPNLKPAAEYYKQELIKLKDELVSDKTIQEVSEFLKRIFGAVAYTLSDIYTRLAAISEQVVAVASENFAKVTDIIAKDILPQIREVISKILDVYLQIVKNVYDIVMIYLVKLSDVVKKHQGEIKQLATAMSESFQDVGRLLVKFVSQLREDVQQLVKRIYDQLKALPIFEELQQRYHDLVGGISVPEQILNIFYELSGTVKEVMPTEEAKQFVSVLQDYIGRKLRNEQIDDAESFKQIYAALIKAINSLVQFVQNQQTQVGATTDYKTLLQNIVPIRFDRFAVLPQLGAAKFSPLNLLLQGIELRNIKLLLWGQSFHPRDNIPPFAHHGLIVQGQHIFTFDERHLTFPGKCSYILARDAINGNFTLVGQFKDGHLEALTFADKHDVITLKSNLQITLNGQPAEMPIRNKQIEVFRLYETVQIVSNAGVKIIAEPHLQIVSVYVNGFYHSQLRGLLGNGNFEPYDDFILPNGKITTNEADFGNGYNLQAGCAAVKTVDHAGHGTNEKCNALFGADSPLRFCFPFVLPDGFSQACAHGLAAGIANTEKYIALAYVTKCRARNILINLPSELLQCTNGNTPVALNDQFSVKVPAKSADIIVVVEQNKDNEAIFKDLVQPVITQLTNELNAKGINDVEISLIGYGGPYSSYPSHYTQGGKLSYHGAAASMKFSDTKREKIETGDKQADVIIDSLRNIAEEVEYQLVVTPEAEAMKEALRYPFRSQAARAVVWVKGENYNRFAPLRLMGRYLSQFSKKDGIHLSVVQPLDSLKSASGKDAKSLKNVVGFNDHGAFTLADAKKKGGDGSAELKKDLDWGLDHTVDYVVDRHGGNVFLANTFSAAKGGQKKQFVQVMAHTIAEDIVNTEYGMDCQCQRTNFYTATNVCKVVSVKEKEPRKGGVKG